MKQVYAKYILSIYTEYMHSMYCYIQGLNQVYTKYIQSESMKALIDLDLRSVWILVCTVIGLHST
jgi:hypothetical protein